MAYVFTPAPDRSDMSVEKEWIAEGFEKTSEMEFYLFVPSPVNNPSASQATSVYQKKVTAGETVSFGQWGVLVF